MMGCDWRPLGGPEDDIYEQVIVRNDSSPGLQGIFYTFPKLNEYNTKDLYKKHPTPPNHWMYYGRSDNIIVFSNGEKLNPVNIEDLIMGHPQVKGAIVVGTMHFQPSLLLEPVDYPKTEEETQKFIDIIWPLIVQANDQTVTHGRIDRRLIRLTDATKPLPRAGKGTIQRMASLNLYRDEMEKLYIDADKDSDLMGVTIDATSEDSLMHCIRRLFQQTLGSKHLTADADFFSAGIDSIQVINATRLLRSGIITTGVNISAENLTSRVIYANPTARKLATYLMTRERQNNPVQEDPYIQAQIMEAQLQRYTRELPVYPKYKMKSGPADEGQTIILTGSTGALGSYLLDFMQTCTAVKKIICLNRSKDGAKRQEKISQARGLSTSFSKAEFLFQTTTTDL
ncbi:nonribosomal peptide synthetase [Colletotrichum tofieldiae]|nr:nonribosomal peptide synthetase [Colletotrichum tofieldiae]